MDAATAQRLHREIQDDLAAGRVDQARQKVAWATRELEPDIRADRAAGYTDVANQKARWLADLQRQVDAAAAAVTWPSAAPPTAASPTTPTPRRGGRGIGRILGFGCLGLIALPFVLAFVLGLLGGDTTTRSRQTTTSTSAPPTTAQVPEPTTLPSVGATVRRGNWEVALVKYGPWEQFATRPPSTTPQGKVVVAEFTAKNLHDRPS